MRRAKILLFVLIIISSFFIFGFINAQILISNVKISGVSTTTDEFVELYNPTSSTITIEGWKLVKGTQSGNTNNLVSSFPAGTSINPFSYFLIAHRNYTGITADLLYSNNSYSLADNNSLHLFDSSESLIDEIFWGSVSTTQGSPFDNPSDGNSLVRLPNTTEDGNIIDTNDTSQDFTELLQNPFNSFSPSRPQFSDPNPTEPIIIEDSNTQPPISNWKSIVINEIMVNPNSDNEWVELYNSSTSSLNLNGGTLCDSRSTECNIANLEGEIWGLGWITILLSGSKLNNDGDSVILKDPNNIIIDEIDYSSLTPKKGQTLARINDGVDTDSINDWDITINPTPTNSNTIEKPVVTLEPTSSSSPTPLIPSKEKKSSAATKKAPSVQLSWNIKYEPVIDVNSSTLFDSHLTSDPRGGEILYFWDFGDGTTAEGSRIQHEYLSSGIYTINIFATSTQNTIDSKSILIKVNGANNANSQILISAVHPNPILGEDEWVKIRNFSISSIDLGGWKIGINNEKWFTIPPNTVINPDHELKFYKTATKLVLNNEGGVISLLNAEGKIVDLVSFKDCERGQTFTLSESGFEWLPKIEKEIIKNSQVKKVNTIMKRCLYSISDALSLPLGKPVQIKGVVESLPGKPGSNYFYVADGSSGIQIYSYKKSFPKLTIGDIVLVSGEIGSVQGINRVKTKSSVDIKIIGKSQPIIHSRTISEIDDNDLGQLVQVEGEIMKINKNSMYLDDGAAEIIINLPLKTEINTDILNDGNRIKVTGILESSKNEFKITPRSNIDVEKIFEPEVQGIKIKNEETTKKFTSIGWTILGGIIIITAVLIKKFLQNRGNQ